MIHSYWYEISDPMAQALLLAVLGLLWLICRRYRTGVALILIAALWATACATPAFAGLLLRGLTSQYPARPASMYPTADAIVVLGGGELPHFSSGDSNDVTSERTTRVGFGLQLFRAGRAPIMLLTGGDREAAQMAALLQRQGVPVTALRTETTSTTTYQNALYSAPLLRAENLRRILLVTSAIHMPRAAASFRKQGLKVIAAPVPRLAAPTHASGTWVPRRSTLNQTRHYLREYLGLLAYKLCSWA